MNASVKVSLDPSAKARLIALMLGCIAFASLIVVRAAYIQILSNPRLESMARRQYQTRSLIRPRRGMIQDRNGEPLAVNVETDSLAANPSKIKNKRMVARLLARSTDLPYSKLLQKLNEKREFIWIKRHLSDLQLRRFRKWRVMDSDGDMIDGLWLVKESERVYPHGQLASHVLGDVNVDSEGLEGVELWKNEALRGKVVSVSAIKDALGRPTFIDAVAAKNVQDGEPITLSIDASLQFEVEQELQAAIQRTGSRSGTVMVMNASTGEILAVANQPTFNPNEKGAPADRRRNRALTDGYEPGSTFKALLAAGVLSQGMKLSDQVWGEKGSFTIQGHKISEAEAKEKFEWVSLKKMIQVSSNVAAAKFAIKLGPDRFLKTIKSFGIGNRSGVGFPGEISGRIPAKKEWGPLTLANIGFGQGILVTPLQMIRAYAAFANGGWLVQPSLLKKADTQDSPEPPVRILTQKIADDVTEALEAVTNEGGTGTRAALPGYRIAGKTGTAQMVDPGTGKYSREKYVASFIGFPVGVEPKVVIFTSLSEPRGNYYAAETAVPLFREVLNSVANRLSLPIRTSPAQLLADHLKRDQIKLTQAAMMVPVDLKLQKSTPEKGSSSGWVMPSLRGMTPREAMKVLYGHRFRLELQGSGVISSQFPEPGNNLAEGDMIRLFLSEP